ADGTITRPVRTLAQGSVLANNIGRNHIIMDAGTYETNTTTTVGNSQNVYGGFVRGADNSWARTSERARIVATLLESQVPAVGVQFNSAGIGMTVDRLDIEVNTLGTAGQSVIGVRCLQCIGAAFSNVSITTGPAARGADGDAGGNGVHGVVGIDGIESFITLPGAEDPCHGNPQAPDSPGAAGWGQPDDASTNSGMGLRGGGNVSLAGAGGTSVSTGSNGRAGAMATEVTATASAANGGSNTGTPDPTAGGYDSRFGWVRAGGSGGGAGFNGAGGGGGSGGGRAVFIADAYIFGFGGASGGTAGCRGDGGYGGAAAGSSIGLILDRSNGVTFSNVSVQSGAGGVGGRGGPGGQGGNGAAGGSTPNPGTFKPGGAGGASSGGGGGGGGGGGAGGSSFAILRDSGTAIGGGVTLSAGAAGAAGPGGAGGMGGQHGDLVDGTASANGPVARDGANGESRQQRIY
ncbi:MAG: hypothetical protein ACI82G_003173, partial [Bradymonadia bacterium]